VLIICDPVSDLAKAYEEGDRIRTEMDKAAFLVQSDLFNYRVDAVTLKEYIRSYDIIHYAGHADYDPDNPSESGWLLHNSKLTAQDIYQMSPNLPLPALVFSNACQSGQTGEWRLDEGYESRIFGLANAFLLSGVQHYIGTFWEVLDESSCEFSAAFYNHLIRGEPIGSAMKKAREHLVEVYGEEQIVWASYMLYGNPATRYVTEQEIGDGKGMSIPSVLGKRAQGIEAFPAGPTRALPPDRRLFNLMTFAYILIGLSLILMVVVMQDRLHLFKGERQPAEPATTINEKKTTEETSAILARLSERYAQQKKQAKEPVPADAWTSRVLTLSLLGFSCIGDCSRDRETEQYILAHLSQDVSRGSRVSLVEREKISQLLEELQLSTADFADQVAAPVMLGKLLGARLIAAGKIVRIKGDNALSLRVFETETSRIVISLAEPWNENDKAGTINRLAQALSREIKTLYPLKGTIARIKSDEILLNIGSRVGVRADTGFAVLADAEPLRMEGKTLGYDEKKIGTIKVATVEENFSRCSIVKQDTPFKEGARVIEVVQ
jgi:hypothetical protein